MRPGMCDPYGGMSETMPGNDGERATHEPSSGSGRRHRPQRTRERVLRTLTFWLRPAFVLRVLNRFQRIAGFDRAIALASGAMTALIPIVILIGTILPGESSATADRIVARYRLTGAGAQAVHDALAPAGGTTTQITVFGVFLLLVAALSFSRAMQRLFEQTWELKPLSVRNSVNDLIWIGGVIGYVAVSWGVHHLLRVGQFDVTANLVVLPLTAATFAWSGRVLSAGRIAWRALAPFAVIGAVAVAIALSFAAAYLPRLFSTYASRYGVIGAVLAMISALFVLMIVIVAAAALGREVAEELDRIGRGERPPDDEVRREWDAVVAQTRLRVQGLWERSATIRSHLRPAHRTGTTAEGDGGPEGAPSAGADHPRDAARDENQAQQPDHGRDGQEPVGVQPRR